MTQPDNKLSRRQFLGKIGISATALGAGSVLLQAEKMAEGNSVGVKNMPW